jgi:hypothetical protein
MQERALLPDLQLREQDHSSFAVPLHALPLSPSSKGVCRNAGRRDLCRGKSHGGFCPDCLLGLHAASVSTPDKSISVKPDERCVDRSIDPLHVFNDIS